MPLLHRRDDVNRRVVVTATGPFCSADMVDFLEGQRDDGTWTYDVLYDTRGMSGHPTIEDLRMFIKLHAEADAEQSPRGPLALLWTDANLYAIACLCAALGGTQRTVDVFRDRDEAVTWLAAQTREPLNSTHLAPYRVVRFEHRLRTGGHDGRTDGQSDAQALSHCTSRRTAKRLVRTSAENRRA